MNKKETTIFIITFSIVFGLLYFGLEKTHDQALVMEVRAYTFPLSEDKIAEASRSISVDLSYPPSLSSVPQSQNISSLEIPVLGVSAPIVLGSSTDWGDIYKNLEDGVVHYSKTSKPGESGVSIILGHSSYPRSYRGVYGTVFDSLDKLKNGDSIKVVKKDGSILNYQVSKSLIIAPDDYSSSALLELETTDNSSLVLMSCWPVGTALKRIAIKADLI